MSDSMPAVSVPVASLGRGMRVEWVDFYGNGVMSAALADAEGQRADVCFDGRANSPTRGRLFEGRRHPGKDGARLLELGGPEEGIIVPLISRWIDSGGPKALGLTERGWELVKESLLRIGEAT